MQQPTKCDICKCELVQTYVDGRTRGGSWGNLCKTCFFNGDGVGTLGEGNGTLYNRDRRTGVWIKSKSNGPARNLPFPGTRR